MKRTIWKYELNMSDEQVIEMPQGTEILSVQVQNGKPCLWAFINFPAREKETRVIEMYGTGHPIHGEGRKFIDTFQLGEFVGHVFEYTGI